MNNWIRRSNSCGPAIISTSISFGLKIGEDGKLAAPLGTVPFHVNAGDVLEAYVVVQNKMIGHSLIPEVRDLYEAWVKFTVTDANGTKIYESGFLKPDGTLESGAHSFTNRPVNVVGEFVDNHVVSAIHSVAYDNTIQSGRSALSAISSVCLPGQRARLRCRRR